MILSAAAPAGPKPGEQETDPDPVASSRRLPRYHGRMDKFTVILALAGLVAGLPAVLTPETAEYDKMSLWSSENVELRGANIYQRRVYPALDGTEFLGPGPFGPPYTQQDFDRLAALGANYVNLSTSGIFSEDEPYALVRGVRDHLDQLLAQAAAADLFAVISLRSGPGRSEFSLFWEDAGDWFDPSFLNDQVWLDAAAQDGWVAMWRAAAEHYRGHPVVVGYDLMVEPNSNDRWLDVWEPEEFYPENAGTLLDWNQLYPRIVAAIREVDPDTPILIGGMSYSSAEWFRWLAPVDDARTVYALHQYEPWVYTHQEPDALTRSYPGTFDPWDEGNPAAINKPWLEDLLAGVDEFADTNGVAVAANEFGLMRWEPGAAAFLEDQIDLFEERGINWALWNWDPAWEPHAEEVNAFNFRFGPDPQNHADVANDLLDVIVDAWSRNTVRPSTVSTPDPGECTADATSLCLQDLRFRVSVTWEDSLGNTGVGQAQAMTPDTGYFWFFNSANVEIVVKVLDGRTLNNAFWVFYGSLSNVKFTLTVTDTETHRVKTYRNSLGRFGSQGDTNAFPTQPLIP